MTTPRQVAEICTNIIKMQGLSVHEQLEVTAWIAASVVGVEDKMTAASLNLTMKSEKPKKVKGSSQLKPTGKIISLPGYICKCTACKKDVFKVVAPVYTEGMEPQQFYDAFEPINHGIQLEGVIDSQYTDGVLFTNCVLCGGELTLLLGGSPSAPAVHKPKTDPVNKSAPVSSIGARDLGIE